MPTKNDLVKVIGVIVLISLFLSIFFLRPRENGITKRIGEGTLINLNSTNTNSTEPGNIKIEYVGKFSFYPEKIRSIRPDIFAHGHFSIFDILVHLDTNGKIDLEFQFDKSMNTHVIYSINGLENWWYEAYYDGGWGERNVFRMDHYPYKDKMTINLHREDEKRIETINSVFREEVSSKAENDGKMIIPQVIIRGKTEDIAFSNVEVFPHDIRNDSFQRGIITAIDVIMSLGDSGRISYELQWYESIGTADVVKSYWVEAINKDIAKGRCGFVYESGSTEFDGFRGNHIHIPSDSRVLNSPEYVEWFWICI